jgi:hypothetical protein
MFTISEPRKSLLFSINENHVCNAKRSDPCQCVIAQALIEKYKESVLEVHVLATAITIILSGGRMMRFRTPKVLREGLTNFDETGEWNLPVGVYKLEPVQKSQTRLHQRERAKKRRLLNDPNMSKKYERNKSKTKKVISPRLIKLTDYRK